MRPDLSLLQKSDTSVWENDTSKVACTSVYRDYSDQALAPNGNALGKLTCSYLTNYHPNNRDMYTYTTTTYVHYNSNHDCNNHTHAHTQKSQWHVKLDD